MMFFRLRRRIVVVGLILLVCTVAVVLGLQWRQNTRDKKIIDQNKSGRDEIIADAQKAYAPVQALYNKTAGVKSISEFEAKFKENERQDAILPLLKRLVYEDKNYAFGLDMAKYGESNYPELNKEIDFGVLAYASAKGANNTVLAAKYRALTAELLRSQGIIGPTDTVPESYFVGDSENE